MKRVLVILLVVCISGQAFLRSAWTLDYYVNRAVYVENCENRDKPNLHCNGKCHLQKKIAASENGHPKEPGMPEGFRQIKEVQLYFEALDFFPCFGRPLSRVESFPLFAQQRPNDVPLAGIFKPPAV